jgi:cytochrome c oxidase subunit 3
VIWMKKPSVIDVSDLPTYAFGPRNPLWWGTQAFMIIEGLAFAFAIATYLYLYSHNRSWPLGPQPGLLWPSLLTGLFLLSEIPNVWVKKAAKHHDLKKVRIGLAIMSTVGIIVLVFRGFEFTTLHIRWDDNAYGSIVWFLIGLHTFHIATDLAETFAMTGTVFLGPVDMRRFPETQDNQDYWHFVVVSWLIIYTTIYWLPRWFEVPA